MRAVVSLGWARLRHRPTRWLLVCLGVAAATVLPVVSEGVSTVVAGQALRYGLESVPQGDRSLAAVHVGLSETSASIDGLDAVARAGLAELAGGPIRLQMLTRSISDGVGGSFYFAATDALPDRIRLTSGRLPRQCVPRRCEVVALGAGAPRLAEDLGLVLVGRAVRADLMLFAGSFDPGDGAVVLVADGVRAAAQLTSLAAFQRSYAWITPIDLRRIDALGVTGYLTRSAAASVRLYGVRLTLIAPDEILRAEANRAQISSRRFALLGGAAMALLLGFAVIGAIGLRRDYASTRRLLRRRGANGWQLLVLVALSSTVPVGAGVILGVLLGAVVSWWLAMAAGFPAVTVGGQAITAAGATVLGGAVAAVLVVAITLGIEATGSAAGSRAAWRAVDVVVFGGLVMGVLAVARGAVTSASLDSGTDPLLLSLPVIIVVCGGLLVGRAWPRLTTISARAFPRRSLAPRLGLLGAIRSPLRPVATAAFLAAATGVMAFAGSYQATLTQGAVDQAAFTVPLDATVRSGPSLRTPLEVATADQYASAEVDIHPVVRSVATVRVSAARSLTPALVGVDPDAFARIDAWDSVVGALGAAEAKQLIARPEAGEATLRVPAGARTLAMPATGTLADVDISAWLRLADGRDIGLPLVATGDLLTTELPDGLGEARLFALTLTETSFAATRRQHHFGEGGTDVAALTGQVELGEPVFGPSGIGDSGGWAGWTSGQATVGANSHRLRIDYALTGAKVVVHPSVSPTPLPVLADATTAEAAIDGLLHLGVSGGAPITARVVGVVPRFPTVGPAFLIADAGALANALDTRDPGTGSIVELWLASTGRRDLATSLAAAPFDLLRADLRQERQHRLASDPLARGAARLLTGSALLAFVVGLVALILLVVADVRDESAQLYAWESDGVAPRTLRLALFLRAGAVVAVGVPGGVLIGLLLSRVTVAIVQVTAVGTHPSPPLALAVPAQWTVLSVILGIAVGLTGCALVAASALRERLPRLPEEGLA